MQTMIWNYVWPLQTDIKIFTTTDTIFISHVTMAAYVRPSSFRTAYPDLHSTHSLLQNVQYHESRCNDRGSVCFSYNRLSKECHATLATLSMYITDSEGTICCCKNVIVSQSISGLWIHKMLLVKVIGT